MPVQPKKKPTVTDIAIRLFISDLLDRNQVRLPHIAKTLGYDDSTVLSKFLKGERNYSRRKINETIDILVKVYNANRDFLKTGHGTMFIGAIFMGSDSSTLREPDNIGSYASRQRIKELEEINKRLEEKIDQLVAILKAKDDSLKAKDQMIELQKQVIENLNQPPQPFGTRG